MRTFPERSVNESHRMHGVEGEFLHLDAYIWGSVGLFRVCILKSFLIAGLRSISTYATVYLPIIH